jgi:hypothetical protein
MQTAVAHNNYNTIGGDTKQAVDVTSTINNLNVTVPQGTSAEQAQAIAKQVDRQIRDTLESTFTGARGTIPSPEARRN